MVDKYRADPPREDLAESVAHMVKAWSSMAAAASDIAHAKRQIFLAYVAEGFTESQALELIKSV